MLQNVARTIDPFDFVPAPSVSARLVGLGPFHLRPQEYEALRESAGACSALLANLTPDGRVFEKNVWVVSTAKYPFERLKSDQHWNGIAPSALWDPAGAWAVVVSNEAHGIIAGDARFVSRFQRNLPQCGGDLPDLVERLYVGDDDSRRADERLFAMMARLYGDAEARRAFSAVAPRGN